MEEITIMQNGNDGMYYTRVRDKYDTILYSKPYKTLRGATIKFYMQKYGVSYKTAKTMYKEFRSAFYK